MYMWLIKPCKIMFVVELYNLMLTLHGSSVLMLSFLLFPSSVLQHTHAYGSTDCFEITSLLFLVYSFIHQSSLIIINQRVLSILFETNSADLRQYSIMFLPNLSSEGFGQ